VLVAAVVEMRAVAVAVKAHVATRVMAAMVVMQAAVLVVAVLHKAAGVALWVTHNHAAMKVVLRVEQLNHAHHALPLALNPTRCAPASI
jgi:hypothetical protein